MPGQSNSIPHVESNHASRTDRPLLHHLNADSSWLLQIPLLAHPTARRFYNILLDPWLSGPQSDVARWFSTQRHAHPPAFSNIAAVSELARKAEDLGGHLYEDKNVIDIVVLSHEFTDHCHRETLEQVERGVLVVAPPKAAQLVTSWGHFKRVVEMKLLGEENAELQGVVPDTLRFSRLQDPKDALQLHSAVVIQFKSNLDETGHVNTATSDEEECVVYTPHGITPAAAMMIAPSISPLCLIHGMHDVWLTLAQQINLGGHNGLKLQRMLKAKYWVGTHDEIKIDSGLVARFIRRKIITLDDALAEESKILRIQGEGDHEDVYFEEIGNGQMKKLI